MDHEAPGNGDSTARDLERILGKPSPSWTAEDLADAWRERGLRLLVLLHVGGDGALKALDFVPRDAVHLRDLLEAGERADGSSLFRDAGIRAGASDVLLRPRPGRAFLDPFAPVPALAVLCGHEGRDGRPLPASPDAILRRAGERLPREAGFDLHAHGELEFFLGSRAGEDGPAVEGESGYHATGPASRGEGLRRRAMAVLAGMGVPLKYGHGEVGAVPPGEGGGVAWEQHEIEMDLAPLPEAADAVVLARWVVGTLARREGLLCSFAPLLREGHAGNGLHFHFAPVVGGRPAEVRGEDGGLAPAARRVVAGLVRAGDALMAFGNRVPESFLRLAQARETPASIAWGDGDRSAMVRLPARRRTADGRPAGAATVEFRLPDGSAHPHLLLAGAAQAIARAGAGGDLDAVLEASASGRRGPGGPLVTTVPRTFREVAEALSWHRASLEAGGVFPPAMLDALVARLSA